MDEVGFEDANQTIEALCAKLNMKVTVRESDVESALWSCNLLSEKRRFWHPKGLTFDEFLSKLLPGASFDKMYNVIKEK